MLFRLLSMGRHGAQQTASHIWVFGDHYMFFSLGYSVFFLICLWPYHPLLLFGCVCFCSAPEGVRFQPVEKVLKGFELGSLLGLPGLCKMVGSS